MIPQTINKVPSAGSMLLKAAFVRKSESETPQLTPSVVKVPNVTAYPKQLERFREVCGFADSQYLPITYPQIMSTALQIKLMLQPEFPFSPIGAVHLRNEISQLKQIGANQPLDFVVQTLPMRQTPNGYEIDFVSQALSENELLWQVVATVLVRRKLDVDAKPKKEHTAKASLEHTLQWELADDLGRRYARASGDYNPIHLYPYTANFLGFKRQIAHGMWSKSRCLAHLNPGGIKESVVVKAGFKLPVYLPTTVTMMHESHGSETQFELRGPTGRRPHLVGSLKTGIAMPPVL